MKLQDRLNLFNKLSLSCNFISLMHSLLPENYFSEFIFSLSYFLIIQNLISFLDSVKLVAFL